MLPALIGRHIANDDFLCPAVAIAVNGPARKNEYYYNSRKEGRQQTDEEYYAELEKLAGDLPIRGVIVDPS